MGKKRKALAKRSTARLPKGLPIRNNGSDGVNPFELGGRNSNKRPKHSVHNRPTQRTTSSQQQQQRPSALAQALEHRKKAVKRAMESSQKANAFVDYRIGEYNRKMTLQEQTLARLVKERTKRSKRTAKYSLQDDDDDEQDVLTHKGKAVTQMTAADHVILSDDEEDYGDLNQLDTDLHFGGGTLGKSTAMSTSIYGPSSSAAAADMTEAYTQRKTELDDLILRRKILKAERLKHKEDQVEVFASMDDSFKELASMLKFRDKEQEIKDHLQAKRAGTLSQADQEMADWDKEMKQYQFLERKVKATDRIKTPEEIAQEQAEKLHELETRRLARMNGDFEDDDLTDISDVDSDDGDDEEDENQILKGVAKSKQQQRRQDHPEALDNDSDSDDDKDKKKNSKNGRSLKFTADGLVEVDANGKILGKVGEPKTRKSTPVRKVGERVSACYHAREQFDGHEAWYPGVISRVDKGENGSITYDIDYDDGDFEEGVEPQHIKDVEESQAVVEKKQEKKAEEATLKLKRRKAKDKARSEIPFVFEVPTTLEALNELIATHASTGEDASLIIQRIHKANSVRLDRRNSEKMQNFYDALLRRFVAVGDAIYRSGDGGPELGRFQQLNVLTETMYLMAQDSPESASAVWSRRLGFWQSAHMKRLRDAEFERDDGEDDDDELRSAWPSMGVVLAIRALGHIFPVTDARHPIVTPTMLLLCQMVAYTPIQSTYDLVLGTLCTGLLVDFTREAKRVVPEVFAFLAGSLRLFAPKAVDRLEYAFALPSLGAVVVEERFASFRSKVSKIRLKQDKPPVLPLDGERMASDETILAILVACLRLLEIEANSLAGSLNSAERELFSGVTESLLCLDLKNKSLPLPKIVQERAKATVSAVSEACQLDVDRPPLQRRAGLSKVEKSIKTLAPRLENPDKYSMSKDKGKKASQVALDRTRRELKRERKAIARELHLDAAIVEEQRRKDKDKRDSAARAKRQKAFAWLESEQAAVNEQVRQGGGLLKGGGMGAAKAKAATAKLGMKKGGKL